MANIHIVTDSSARFSDSQLLEQHPITVLPNELEINGVRYREGIDLSAEDALQLIQKSGMVPRVIPPTVDMYGELYAALIQSHDAIVSIHTSRDLAQNWKNARHAAQQMSGSREIAVIDSRTICAGLGMLVKSATKIIQKTSDIDQIVKQIRGAIDRTYTTYYVDSPAFLRHNKVMTASHGVLGEMLGIKPFLSIEEGALKITEKVRNRTQAVERLVEFLVEFTDVEDAMILQSQMGITEQTRILQDRLALEFPDQTFPYTVYSPSLAAWIGTDATGVVILESELDYMDYGL